jgi:hypothetical protein
VAAEVSMIVGARGERTAHVRSRTFSWYFLRMTGVTRGEIWRVVGTTAGRNDAATSARPGIARTALDSMLRLLLEVVRVGVDLG